MENDNKHCAINCRRPKHKPSDKLTTNKSRNKQIQCPRRSKEQGPAFFFLNRFTINKVGQAKYKLKRNGENAPQKYPLELTCKSIKCYLISFNAFSWMRKIATKEMSRSRISLGRFLFRKESQPGQPKTIGIENIIGLRK